MSLPVYLHDFSHEASEHEAIVFYGFYLIIELYLIITVIALFIPFLAPDATTYVEKSFVSAMLLLFMPSVIPFIFCSILSMIIMIRKKIKTWSIFNLVVFTMIFTLFLPNCLGMTFALLIPAFLMTREDNSVEKYDRILKLQLAEHDRKIEAQLEKEQIIKKLHKEKDQSGNVIHIEFTRAEDDYTIFHAFD